MRKRSTPRSTSTGHTASRNAAAITKVPSDTLGATFFEAKATAKWPMNISVALPEHGLFEVGVDRFPAEPDLQQCGVKILPGNRLAPGRAVHSDPGSRLRQKIERDHRLFVRAPDFSHDGSQGVDPSLERGDLGLRMIGP